MDAEPNPARPAAGTDAKYIAVVGGLLVLIILLLGGLWLRERRISAALRRRLATTTRGTVAQGNIQAMLNRVLGKSDPAARGLPRDDLPSETVQWNGRPRDVLRISAAAGKRIGLLPGDVVVVSPEPTTAPATSPAAQPREAGR